MHKEKLPPQGKLSSSITFAFSYSKTLPAQGETPDGHRLFIRAGQTLLTRGKFPAKPEKRTSEAAPYTERPSFLSNTPRLCFTSLHAQRKASNKCRRSPRAWNRRALKSLLPASFETFPRTWGRHQSAATCTPSRKTLSLCVEQAPSAEQAIPPTSVLPQRMEQPS